MKDPKLRRRPIQPQDALAYRIVDVCRFASMGRTKFYAMCKAGRGPAIIRDGGMVRVSRVALLAWLATLQG